MHRFPNPEDITPTEFELMVKSWFESVADSLDEFTVQHLETIQGSDGEFAFDVTIRFTAFHGAKFLVVAECKKHKSPIKRDVVQVLNEKKRSVGAHKGFVISTSPFQSGAQSYALRHGIALCQVHSGNIAYIQSNAARISLEIEADADPYVATFPFRMADGKVFSVALIERKRTYWLEQYLLEPQPEDD
jgi:restriction system protein